MRLFAAVWPDAATAKRLASLELGPTDGLRLVGSANWHITLRFFGEVDEDWVPELVGRLETAAEIPDGPVDCQIGPATAWFGDRVLQIPARGLEDVAAAVSATVPVVPDTIGGEPRFNGHLTIARPRGRRLDPSVRAAVAGIPFVTAFDVSCFDLVASRLTDDGPRYTPLARFNLPG